MNMITLKALAKKSGVAMLFGALIILAGTALLGVLIINGVIHENGIPYGLYVTLFAAGLVCGFVGAGENKIVALTIGVLSPLCILVAGNVALCDVIVGNIPVTVAAIFSGAIIPVLMSLKKSNAFSKTKNYKMVNLYKKHGVGK